ncbi:MAG: hypothetical protein U1F09_09010 [Steroidobacteraceae bacterium]
MDRPLRFRLHAWAILCAATFGIAALSACVEVEYLREGRPVEARPGEAVVFGRIRFMDDGREWSPWNPSFLDMMLDIEPKRHFWLRRLDRTAISAELHPDDDGSVAIRLHPGDYALVGTDEDIESIDSTTRLEIVALLRVPADQPLVYAGDVVLVTRYREGWTAVTRWLGEPVLDTESKAPETAALEAKYGPLPGPLAISYWCVSNALPVAPDYEGLHRALDLLNRGCPP